MRQNSSYRYRILLQDRQIGPFDRRTIVGMRVKKLLENHVVVLRSDGLQMTVETLLADRFEMADAVSSREQAESAPASGIWPTFLVDFGGGLRPGALGFNGRGELRYQGDLLRLTGRRKSGFFGSNEERVKISIAHIASAVPAHVQASVQSNGQSRAQLKMVFKPGAPAELGTEPILIGFEDSGSVQELMELLGMA